MNMAAIFINDHTLTPVEMTLAWAYLIFVMVAIPVAAVKAHKNRKEGIAAYHKVERQRASSPHPDYVLTDLYADNDESRGAAEKRYREANGKQYQSGLWIHILLPAIIGTLLGFILMILSTFARWVRHKGDVLNGDFHSGMPDLFLATFVIIGLLLAAFLPIELVNKKKNNYFDYALAIWAAFGVAFAATLLGF